MATVGDDAVGRPGRDHRVDRLVGELVAFVEVDAERAELRAEVARRDTEDHPTAGEPVETQHRLGGEKRIAIRDDEDVRLQAQGGRGRTRDGEHDHRVERVVTARLQPTIVGKRVVGDVAGRESRGLGRGRELRHRRAGDELVDRVDAIRRQPDREFHVLCVLDGSGGDGRRARTAHEAAGARALVGRGAQGHLAALDGGDVTVGALHESAAVAREVVHHLGACSVRPSRSMRLQSPSIPGASTPRSPRP